MGFAGVAGDFIDGDDVAAGGVAGDAPADPASNESKLRLLFDDGFFGDRRARNGDGQVNVLDFFLRFSPYFFLFFLRCTVSVHRLRR
jgi:hypothetical protein